jgi:hypothetical protein
VVEIMTARHQTDAGTSVWMLDVSKKLDFDTMMDIYKTGYTRIPICDGDEKDPQSPVVGLLLTKDLMLVDPEDEIEIRLLLSFCGRDITPIPDSQTLDKMLEMLTSKGTKTHLFFIQPQQEYLRNHSGGFTLRDSVQGVESLGVQGTEETENSPRAQAGESLPEEFPRQEDLHAALWGMSMGGLFARGRRAGLREERLCAVLDDRAALVDLLADAELQRARHHQSGLRRPLHHVVGIVTMEDLLEELIQAEIQDETDVYTDNMHRQQVRRGRSLAT